jgi:cystathionine beta-lyase/cystathionine gamma-synthase
MAGASDSRGSRPGMGLSTLAVHAGSAEADVGAPLTTPVYQTSTFFNDPDGGGEVLYTRYGNNPNHLLLEARIAALEGAEACVVAGSGMAAMAMALLSCAGSGARSGARIVAAEALYGGTRLLLDRELPRLGIRTTYADFSGPDWREVVAAGADVVVVEVPTNPMLRVVDLPAIAAASRDAGAVLVVDATFATPINLRPLSHGADLVVHSATKYLGGHSDVTAGAVAGAAARIAPVRERAQIFGPALDPHAAWLVERGIKTLAVRVERHNRNGMAVAAWCASHPRIRRVHYPGLGSHPDHERAARLLDGFGGMLGLELEGAAAAASVLRRLRLARVAPSLGGVETLVSEPRHTSHASLAPQDRERLGIPDGFLRFSLGIEDAADIIADLEAALDEA